MESRLFLTKDSKLRISGIAVYALACGLVGACGSTDPADNPLVGIKPIAGASGNPGSPEEQVGFFDIKLVAPVAATAGTSATPGFTSMLGKIYDGPVPESLAWEQSQEAGGCRLLLPHIPFCGAGCGSAVCVADDQCVPNPATRDAGTVTVRGVRTEAGMTEFSLTPIRNTYVNPAAIKLPYPAFAEGDELELSAAGAAVSPFSIKGTGIAPLELPDGMSYELVADQALALTWTPPGKPNISRVQVKLDISHHGGTKGKIECDVEDDGSLEIPATMVTELLSLGIAGFPTVALTRSSVGSTTIPEGRVDLEVYSYVERAIEIEGLVSCTENSQCGAMGTCGDDKRCQ
jgi:hypothetical protein